MNHAKLLKTGIIGSIVMMIFYFTPVLVLLFGALGLGAYVSGLDFGLLPLLGISFCLIVFALIKRQMNKAATS